MERFDIWQYHSVMNRSELPYPYRIFLVFPHNKLNLSSFLGILGNRLLTYMVSFHRRKVSDNIRNPNYKEKI